jgi:hypothetical protein
VTWSISIRVSEALKLGLKRCSGRAALPAKAPAAKPEPDPAQPVMEFAAF